MTCPTSPAPLLLARALCLTVFSFPGEEFYEASPYEPVTSRLSDIFRLASIFSGKRARAGASPVSAGPGGTESPGLGSGVLAVSSGKPPNL